MYNLHIPLRCLRRLSPEFATQAAKRLAAVRLCQRHNPHAGRWCQPLQGGFLRKLLPLCDVCQWRNPYAGRGCAGRRAGNPERRHCERSEAIHCASRLAWITSPHNNARNDGRQPAACKTRKPPHKSIYKCHFFTKNFQKFRQNAICRLYIIS